MTRREYLALSMGGVFAARGASYRDYARCLPEFLHDLAEESYRARNRELEKLTNARAIAQRQRWVGETFWKLAGGMPERTPLNARVLGAVERPGYRLEKILYQSRPELHIPANLYVPTSGQPPFPGVLFQMGHSHNGKAEVTYQKCCQGLARLGYLVLAFDPMGQGERTYYPNAKGYLSRLYSPDNEHTLPGKQMLLTGDTATRMQVWDAVRSLDYLAAHPLVDPKRLASTGHSGGGTLTMMLAAVDERLAAAVVSCGNTENLACADFSPPGSTDDAEQDFLGSGPLSFDRWDLLYPLAPKPLLIMVSAADFFGTYSPRYVSNGLEEYQKLRKIYAVLGNEEHLEWADTPLPHELAYYLRMRTYNWFERWLKSTEKQIEHEPPVAPEPDEVTWVGPTGNVVRDFQSATPFQLNRKRAAAIETPRQPKDLRGLLGVTPPSAELRATVVGRVPSEEGSVEAIEAPSAPKVWVPAWLFTPEKVGRDRPVLLLLDPRGRGSRWAEGGFYHSLAASGCVVCAPDLRGSGDLSAEVARGEPGYAISHDTEDEFAWASLILGKPLLGQRVTDVCALVAALRRHPAASGRRIVLAAAGKMTVPALFAAALEPEIQSLYLSGGLVSFRNLVETENYKYPLVNFIPGILARTDLPEVAAALAPRRIYLAGTVDAEGRKMDVSAIRDIYQADGNVEILPEADWSVTRLSNL